MHLDYLKILVTIILALAGWMFGHYFSTQRDIKARKRELVTEHLLQSFEAIVAFSAVIVGNGPSSRNMAENFNTAVTKIQLLGSAHQIKLINEITKKRPAESSYGKQLNSLLIDLRKELRVELNLPDVDEEINVARIVWVENSDK